MKLPKHLGKKKLHKSQLTKISGVYFLSKDNEVVYIGESECVYSRICQHEKEGLKEFDSFCVERIDGKEKRKKLEARHIKYYRPICNLVHNPNVTIKA